MKKAKKMMCFLLSLTIVLLSLVICDKLCVHPGVEFENSIDSFYREEYNSLDCVFLGASATQMDIYPSEIWKNCGITSYNIAIPACPASMYKSMLTEIISKQPNTILIVDIDGFCLNDTEQTDSRIDYWINAMPRNKNRIDTINTYVAKEERIRYYFPFIDYHRNMTSLLEFGKDTYVLESNKIKNKKDSMFGGKINFHHSNHNVRLFSYNTSKSQAPGKQTNDILTEFLDFCKSSELRDVVFLDYPRGYYENDDTYKENIRSAEYVNYIRKTVAEYGYDVISYSEFDNPANIDIENEFADHMHLRPIGAKQFSSYIAGILSDRYSFSDKNEQTVKDWNQRSKEADLMIANVLNSIDTK